MQEIGTPGRFYYQFWNRMELKNTTIILICHKITHLPHHRVFFLYFQVYEGLQYKLTFDFPSGYPYQAPTVRFDTPCYHPNVDKHGNICLDILKEKWSALYDVRTILLSLQSLLGGNNIYTEVIWWQKHLDGHY